MTYHLVRDLAAEQDISPYDVLDTVEASAYELDDRRFYNLREVLAYLRLPWHWDRAGEVILIESKATETSP